LTTPPPPPPTLFPYTTLFRSVHLESFAAPGQTLLGTDSHTPLCGAAGMLAIGAGGLDVAVAMGGGPYAFAMPEVVRVWLTGELQDRKSTRLNSSHVAISYAVF